MSLRTLVSRLSTAADGDALVDHIYGDGAGDEISQENYLDKYFDPSVRKAVFSGGVCTGRSVRLSPKAQVLKSALQRRYATTGEFKPTTGYHATNSAHIARLVVDGGFIRATNTLYGHGVYFFTTSDPAEPYATEGGASVKQGEGIVLEVTIFSAVTKKLDKPRRDKLTFQWKHILVVKNPLVIFPKAVFVPGEKRFNVEYPGMEMLGRVQL
jgi:hypothetical protein